MCKSILIFAIYLKLFMKNIFYILCLFVLFSCTGQTKKAKEELEKARAYYQNEEFSAAKLTVDSIKIKYPKEFSVQKEGLQLMRVVKLAEQKRNLAYCDSMLKVKLMEAEPLKKNFVFEKIEDYDDVGKYIYKQQVTEKNIQRSYIRSGVNEKGEMYIASVYYGSRPVKHSRLKVSSKNGEYAETENVLRDGGANYSFTDGGMTTETVTYLGDKGKDVALFIYDRQKEPVKATYLGETEYSIQISDADKKALAETYDLAIVLSDIERLKKEIETAKLKSEYLEIKTSQHADNE